MDPYWTSDSTQKPPYVIDGTIRDYLYFLVDGIYPSWSIFMKTNSVPTSEEELKFSKRKEAVRKDIERCFGVLSGKYTILQKPMRGCVI